MNNKIKKRYWTFIIYEDSAPLDWRDYLDNLHIPFTISPFHYKDFTSLNEPKKAHYHVVLYFDGPTTYNNVLSLVSSLGVNTVQFVQSPRGMYRYLCHLDNPEKAQYDPKEIIEGGGFNYEDIIGYTSTEELHIIQSIYRYIKENNIISYSQLIDRLQEEDLLDLFEITQLRSYTVNLYLSSRRDYQYLIEEKKNIIKS